MNNMIINKEQLHTHNESVVVLIASLLKQKGLTHGHTVVTVHHLQ